MNPRTRRELLVLFTLLLRAVVSAPAVFCQDGPPARPSQTPLTAPPPRKLIPKNERSQLDQSEDSKQRVRLTIEMAGAHLGLAEKETTGGSFDAAAAEG